MKWLVKVVSKNSKTGKLHKDYFEENSLNNATRIILTFKPKRGYTVVTYNVNKQREKQESLF